jgi:hypothetical protein
MAKKKQVEEKQEEKFEAADLGYYKGNGSMKGLLTIYCDVGQLPPYKAMAFIERLKESWKTVLERLPEDYGVIFIPVRSNSMTRVETVPLQNI